MTQVPFGIGCDHAGLELKTALVKHLADRGISIVDFGTNSTASCDYPDFAHALARSIEGGTIAQGLLICGTGVGMSMAANRHPAVRAVVCSEPLSARMARRHNDANVLCLGARVIGVETAFDILDAFLGGNFEGGRHERRVQKIDVSE